MPNYRTTELPEGIRVGKIMSFFTTRFDCGTLVKNRRETYPFWAMIYTLGGNMTFQVGEEIYRVSAGELIFYPADLPHSIIDAGERMWEVSFVTFKKITPILVSESVGLPPESTAVTFIVRLRKACAM